MVDQEALNKKDAEMEKRKQDHRDHIQDIYNKTYKAVDDRLKEFEEKQKLMV